MEQVHKIAIIGGTTYDHIVYLPAFPRQEPYTIHKAVFNEGTGSTGSGKAITLTKLAVDNTLYSEIYQTQPREGFQQLFTISGYGNTLCVVYGKTVSPPV